MFTFRKNKDTSFLEIEKLREDLGTIDLQLMELITKRYEIAKSIGNCKNRDNIGVFSPERENEILRNLIRSNKSKISEIALTAIFKEIISGGRAVEANIKIVSKKWKINLINLVIKSKFGSSVKISFKDSFETVFSAISNNPLTTYGIIPLEVSDEKTSHKAVSSLARTELKICSDIILQKNNSKKTLRFAVISGHSFEIKPQSVTTLIYLKLKEAQLVNNLIDILNKRSNLETKMICLYKKESSFLIEVAASESSKQFTFLNEQLASMCLERKIIGFYTKEKL